MNTRFEATELGASLTVKDLDASTAWYTDVVGFAVEKRYEREGNLFAVSLSAGSVRILLTRDDGAKGERAKGEGFSLQLTTTQGIDALAAGIRERGGVLEGDPMTNPWGARFFRLRDPDGFRYTFSSGNAKS